MQPQIRLDGSVLRANVRAFAARGAPVAAVLKNDGYGWGAASVARELDEVVESYVVADEAEFWALRPHTRRTIRLLEAADPAAIARLCAHGAVPNIVTGEALAAAAAFASAAGRPVTVRVGVIDVAGWAGIGMADAAAFAQACARGGLRVELWTHITSAARAAATGAAFSDVCAVFTGAGADVVSTDTASTAWAAQSRAGDRLRIGAGLFGARFGGNVATACAIRVVAPLVRWYEPGTMRWAGYGDVAVPVGTGVAVLRCGYGDGLPAKLLGNDDILTIGMQYTTRLAQNAGGAYALIDERSDLDQLARRVGLSPHELIVGLARKT